MKAFSIMLLAGALAAGGWAWPAGAAAANASASRTERAGTGAPPASAAADPALEQLVQIVDARYNSLTTLRAEFIEIYTGSGESHGESGMLYLRKPGKMLWQYREPQPKIFLVDGRNVWLYVRGDAEAEQRSLKNSSDLRTPLRWLLGKMELKKELSDLSFGGLNPLTPGDWVVRGAPRFMTDQFREVLLEISPAYDITRIVIRSVDGTQTDFRLSQIEGNRQLPAALFRFTPPPGVKVVPAPD